MGVLFSSPKRVEHRVKIALALFLVVILPATLLAQTPAGMLYANGTVVLNGTPVSRPTAIFAGAVIETQNQGTAILRVDGATVVVSPDSKVVFNGTMIELRSGAVKVTTSNNTRVEVAQVSVAPLKDKAVYRVVQESCKAEIHSEQDPLAITAGHTWMLAAGGWEKVPDCVAGYADPAGAASTAALQRGALVVGGIAAAGVLGSLSGTSTPLSPVKP